MIARFWHGRTTVAKAAAYLEFLERRTIPDYRATAGNKSALVLHRIEGNEAHIITFILWESIAAIRGFAGSDVARAKYYPEDDDFLLEFEPTVQHYDVATSSVMTDNQ